VFGRGSEAATTRHDVVNAQDAKKKWREKAEKLGDHAGEKKAKRGKSRKKKRKEVLKPPRTLPSRRTSERRGKGGERKGRKKGNRAAWGGGSRRRKRLDREGCPALGGSKIIESERGGGRCGPTKRNPQQRIGSVDNNKKRRREERATLRCWVRIAVREQTQRSITKCEKSRSQLNRDSKTEWGAERQK